MSALVGGSPWRPGTRSLASLVLALLAWFVVAVLTMHWLRPELEPAGHRISEYALGPFGILMASAFAAGAVATLLLLLGLLREGPMTWPARGAKALLTPAVLGLAIAALLPLDPPGETRSVFGLLHDAGLLAFVLTSLVAAFLLTLSFTLDDRWRPVVGISVLLAATLTVEVVLLLRAVGAHEPWGIVNRAYALTAVTWISAVALRLLAVARS